MTNILNSICPVFVLIALGAVLRRSSITNDDFLKTSDKLIYFIFFPVLLFWKIGAPRPQAHFEWRLSLSVLAAVLALYLLSLLFVRVFRVKAYRVGAFSQSCYRFNTYIGMAIILNAVGDEGLREFGVMIGVAIPFINLLAVSTLIWFSEKKYANRERYFVLLKATLSNPLILACVAGILYSRTHLPFPVFLDNLFSMLSLITLPMALISIGGALNFHQLRDRLGLALVASAFKLLVFPVMGYALMRGMGVSAVGFQVGMIFFSLPTSTAVYILSSQLNSDVKLASASIVVSTLLSILSLSISILLFCP